jgi:two-component system OmpR family response regulator
VASRPPDASDDARGSPRVLVVEDDAANRDGLIAALAMAGYRVAALADGLDLDRELSSFQPDLVVLDIYLPRGPDGFALATTVRAERGVPVLFVTAADAMDERLRGFDLGADDYIVKPYAIAEVLARVRAVLRRAGRLASPTLEIRDLLIDEETRTARRAGERVDLSANEFDVLCILARKPGTAYSKTQLLLQVWGSVVHDPNLVEVCVSSIRRKLEVFGPRLIFTIRGEGYVLRR